MVENGHCDKSSIRVHGIFYLVHDQNTIDLVAPFCLSIYITPLLINGSTLLLFEKGKYYRVTLNIFLTKKVLFVLLMIWSLLFLTGFSKVEKFDVPRTNLLI